MTQLSVKCGCGRTMNPDGRAGRNAFRCGCGARVQVTEHQANVRRCTFGECRTLATTKEPLRLCQDHETEAAKLLGHLAGALTVEHFLERSGRTWWRYFGSSLTQEREGQHLPVVYFARRRGERLIKIGTSTNLRSRMSQLGMVALAAQPGARPEESQLHRRFAPFHSHLEFFEPAPELLAYVREVRRLHGPPESFCRPVRHARKRSGGDSSETLLT
jgi:hypothetical protein